MKKKLILAAAGIFSIFTLVACSSGTQDIASMKGATITVDDFYKQVRGSQESQNTVRNMIVYKVFEDKYGKDITDKDVQKKYDETKKAAEAQGTKLEDYLKQQGLTEADFKKQLRQNLAFEAGLKAKVKITDEDLKEAWATFHPEVEAQIITVATEDEAKAIKKELTDGGDFTKIAKEKSTDASKKDGGKVKFDSQTQEIPAAAKDAAFKLKDGEISEPIQATDSTGYQSVYYIIKMTKNTGKGNDMKPYEKELKKIAEEAKLSNQEFVAKVISDALKEANVKIKDDAFKEVLTPYLQTEDSAAKKDSSEKSKDSSSDKKEKASDSSAKEETSSSSKTEDSSK